MRRQRAQKERFLAAYSHRASSGKSFPSNVCLLDRHFSVFTGDHAIFARYSCLPHDILGRSTCACVTTRTLRALREWDYLCQRARGVGGGETETYGAGAEGCESAWREVVYYLIEECLTISVVSLSLRTCAGSLTSTYVVSLSDAQFLFSSASCKKATYFFTTDARRSAAPLTAASVSAS
jgi:hypothetical protein